MTKESNINIVSEAIAQLLMRHNCVIIPTLGGFIGNYEPSKILPHANKIIPPSKSILFNANLVNNDGLLIQHIADENQFDYNTSEKIVSAFVNTAQTALSEGNRFELYNVGFLFLQQNDQIGFEQDHAFNMYMNSFGLGSVRFVTFEGQSEKQYNATDHKTEKDPEPIIHHEPSVNKVVEEPVVEEKEVQKEAPKEIEVIRLNAAPKEEKPTKETSIPEEKSPSKRRSFKWGYAAAALALPIVFYSLWIPMKSDVLKTNILQVEDFNPFHATPDESYSPRTAYYNHQLSVWEKDSINFSKVSQKAKYFNVPFIEGKMITVDLSSNNKSSTDNEVVEKDEVVTSVIKKSVTQNFHLIAGCFGKKSNAKDMINQLKNSGFEGLIVDKNKGLYRVSAIQASSKNELLAKRNQLVSAGFKSWVLKK